MAKPYPEWVALKNRKCPQCGSTDFGHPDLVAKDSSVEAACREQGCGFKLELFWIGDRRVWSN